MLTYKAKKSTIKLHMINPWLKFYMSCCRNHYLLYILDKKVESRKSKLLLLHVLNFEIIWNPHNNFEIVGLTVLHSRHWVKLTTGSRDELGSENKSWLHTVIWLCWISQRSTKMFTINTGRGILKIVPSQWTDQILEVTLPSWHNFGGVCKINWWN